MLKRLAGLILAVCLWASTAQAFTVAVGTYTGDGTATQVVTFTPTFTPAFIFVKGNAPTDGWMPAVNFGCIDKTFSLSYSPSALAPTGGIKACGSGTFSVGDTGLSGQNYNESGSVFYYVVFGQDANNDLAIGTYTTTASPSDNRDITISPAFLPEFCIVRADTTAASGVWRGSHAGDLSSLFAQAANAADNIQSFGASGFQVGLSSQVQPASATIYYVCFKAVTNYTSVGSYSGNNGDDRSITGPGFSPNFLFNKSSTSADRIVYRFSNETGDLSFWGANSEAANLIQAFEATGFQVGTAQNTTGIDYYYWAVKTPVYAAAAGDGTMTFVIE